MTFSVSVLTSLAARIKGKGQSPRRKARVHPGAMEPRVVYVEERPAEDGPVDYRSVLTGVLSLSSDLALKHDAKHRRCQWPLGRRRLALPHEMLVLVLSFTPMDHFTESSLVCQQWAAAAKVAARLNIHEARSLVDQGLTLMATSNCPAMSINLFSRALELHPNMSQAAFWKAKGLFIMGEEEAAADCLETALTRNPPLVEKFKLQACLLYTRNNDLKASQLLLAALQHAPADASIHFELGFCYHGLQQFQQAIRCYTQANTLGYSRTFVLLANRANCLFRVGRVNDALDDLSASLDLSPHYELALRTRAFVYTRTNQPTLAYADYTDIILNSTTPKVIADAYCNRAFCYGDMEEGDIDSAMQADPTNPEPVRYKAAALVNQGSSEEAIALVTLWIEANATHKDRAFQFAFRGELHAGMGDREAAIKDYKQALRLLRHVPPSQTYAGFTASATMTTYRDRLFELLDEHRNASQEAYD